MLKAFVFGGYTFGDRILKEMITTKLDIPTEYCGSRVDLSKINPEDSNIIVIINRNTFELDLHIILGYIKKDLTKPLIVWKKIRTFGAAAFSKNVEIENIFVNKFFIFAGILYIPKENLKNTMADTLKGLDKGSVRSYFLPDKIRKN